MRTLGLRMKQHSTNALYLAERFEQDGWRVIYPGLPSHPGHQLMGRYYDQNYGYGGLLTLDVGNLDNAHALMEEMQAQGLGFLAVSLGFHKTLFSAPGVSTSSEIPVAEQTAMGLHNG